ncbi:MAG: asparagine synthase (glutamine-hydrolyzing) [Acidobacteriota bacterium]
MCGIAGELRLRSDAGIADPVAWRDRMRRRGPDAGGLVRDEQLTLVFRRLAILDPTPDGDQPMATADGNAVLLWNGELYNFRALRDELEAAGRVFRSTGDTEVVLQALDHWGPAALERFDAMFALAFHDRRRRTLLLARDGLGIKPLYVGESSRGVVFASQYDLLLRHPWWRDASLDPEAVSLVLRLGHLPAPWAMLDGTRMLEPGTWLEIAMDGASRSGTFWAFDRDRPVDLRGPEALEAIHAAIDRSVAGQMVSDVPLGTFLSGGIDSPLVTAIVAALAGGVHPAFTLSTSGAFDESADARAYAAELPMPHVVEPLPEAPSAVEGLFDQALECAAEPFDLQVLIPQLVISRCAAERVRVALSGDGGDELFWGYVGRFASVLERVDAFRRPLGVRRLHGWWTRRTGLGGGDDNLGFATVGDWVRAKHSKIQHARLGRVFDQSIPWPSTFRAFDYRGHELDETARWLRWNEIVCHLPYVLLKVDRASMYHSLETRVPLLGREVVETAARVDWRSCLELGGGLGKLPLRAALKRRLRHASRTKRGFAFSGASWLRGPLRERLRDTLVGRRELLGMPLRRDVVEQMVDEHIDQRYGAEGGPHPTLWVLLSMAAWDDRWRATP